eukprot:1730215-Rhodomonas_salina.1
MLGVEGGEEERAVPELNHPAARAVRVERERGRESVRGRESGDARSRGRRGSESSARARTPSRPR